MELFKLTVAVVSNVLPPADGRFRITARSETGQDRWASKLFSADEYRAAMSATTLTTDQIESPIRTGLMTEFGGAGGGERVFEEEVLVKMGLRKQPA